MITLGLDTATSLLSIALIDGGKTLALETSDARRGQSEELLPLIDACCAKANCKLSDISRIVAVTGPGSFTGLRIGLAAAKGLAMGLCVPAGGISSFETVRLAVPEANVIVLESWREELFVQFGDDEPLMLTPFAIAEKLESASILAGDGATRITGAKILPCPPLAPYAARTEDMGVLAPFYLRSPDVTPPAS